MRRKGPAFVVPHRAAACCLGNGRVARGQGLEVLALIRGRRPYVVGGALSRICGKTHEEHHCCPGHYQNVRYANFRAMLETNLAPANAPILALRPPSRGRGG